jgi:glycogen operon protein
MVHINGTTLAPEGPRRERVVDSSFLLLFNGSPDPMSFTVPLPMRPSPWCPVVDTSRPDSELDSRAQRKDDWKVGAWSVVVLEQAVTEEH